MRFSFGYEFVSASSGRYDLAFSLGRLSKNFSLYMASLLYSGGGTLDIFLGLKVWRVLISGIFSLLLLLSVAVTTFRLSG